MAEQKKTGKWKKIGYDIRKGEGEWERVPGQETDVDEGGFDTDGDEYYIEPCVQPGCDQGMRTYIEGEGEDNPLWTRDDDNRPYCPDHCYLVGQHEYENVECEQCERKVDWDHTANIPTEEGWTASMAGEDEYRCPTCSIKLPRSVPSARPSTSSRKEAAEIGAERGRNLHKRKLGEIATASLLSTTRTTLDRARKRRKLEMPPPTQMSHLASMGETKTRKKRGGPGSPRGGTRRRRLRGGKKSRKKRRRRKTRRRRRKRSKKRRARR